MKRVFGILFVSCYCFLVLQLVSHNLRRRSRIKTEETTPKLAEQASSAIVIEQDTGKVLFDKNPNEKLPPA